MLSEWYVLVLGDAADVALLEDLLRPSTEHSVAREGPGEWRLRSSRLAGLADHEAAWVTLRELLAQLADAAAANAGTRLHLNPGAMGRTKPDGTSDIFVHPEPVTLRLRAFPPTIIIGGEAGGESPGAKMLRLQAANDHLRLAIHFLNAEESWFDLFKAFEVIRAANRGESQIIANGWAAKSAIDRFRQTANSYWAVGDAARHARLGHRRPEDPMTLTEADDFVRALLSQWLASLP